MRKHYSWLCFDADDTLFDYNRAEAIALKNAFLAVNAPFQEDYLDVYREINRKLWRDLERQAITTAVLQVRRFELLLEALQLTYSADQIGLAYVEQLGLCSELKEGAYDVLHVLQRTSRIAIVTNGLQAVQRSRLEKSPIRDFISELIISEEVGASKPKAAFFDAAFTRMGYPAKSEVLIIGDSLTSDMRGGADYGIDTCWYNPTGDPRPHDLRLTYEIAHLRELLDVVE